MMARARTAILFPIVCFLSCAAGFVRPAFGQQVDPATAAAAQTLYDHAVKSIQAGDFATACPKLEEVVRLVPEGVGAKITLAECYEGAGRLASAWTTFAVAEAAAARANQAERQQKARERAQGLESRVARIAVQVSPDVAALEDITVERDGVLVGKVQWGVPVPVDRGEHIVVVRAKGKRPWRTVVPIETDGITRNVFVRSLPDAAGPAPGDSVEADPPKEPPGEKNLQAGKSSTPVAVAPARNAEAPAPMARTLGIGAGLLGLGCLGVGSVLGGMAIVKRDESNTNGHCIGNRCDDVGTSLRNEGLILGNASTGLFVGGGLMLAGGLVLYVVTNEPKGPGARVALGPRSVVVAGSF